MLRVPSSRAVSPPESGVPPAASTPTKANCEAPVNITSESAQVCATERPAATETAPKDTPYAPVATPTPRLSRRIAARSAALRVSSGTGRP